MRVGRWLPYLVLGATTVALLLGAPRLLRLSAMAAAPPPGPSAETVVLLHGLGRTSRAMLLLEADLVAAGYRVENLGYDTRSTTPQAAAGQLAARIEDCCSQRHAPVHFVGHSLGGLMVRAVLDQTRPRQLGRVVLIGTPNRGSELADADAHPDWLECALEKVGPAARSLGTGPDGFAASLPPPDYEVGVIAGTRSSALAGHWLPVPNDGLVSLASARLPGAVDEITFDVGHARLRGDPRVAQQTLAFLAKGNFDHGLRIAAAGEG